jgi:transcriptional regulator with XRE-family HTH domain
MNLTERMGSRIRWFRQQKGMRQLQLATAAKLTRSHISQIEGGKLNVTIKNIEAICRALEVQPEDLFDTVKIDMPQRIVG